jgi:MscS family membrane protein
MLLIGDRSFRAGDLVVVQGEHGPPQEGTIVSVGFRSTRLKTKEDSVLLIPNSNLANSVIDNLGMRQTRRIHGEWFLPPETPAGGVLGFREEWKQWLDGRREIDQARTEVCIQGPTAQGIKLLYTVFVKGGAMEETRLREEMTLKILELCHNGKLGHMEGAERS